ncbi:hypothetical protein ACFQDN_26580 [Pseudomonas asuensis]|uniref:DNA repair protein n=1 Tax=Pseudomonas asuensis TaxID=1825787 RepID=A0ABQ2GWT9_9PSED|nr:hypothetical protein [Pseudomonas asuensis]GGM15968.1 hypothetical protein GCM10009425_28540 [Pseudomonas asuensis]
MSTSALALMFVSCILLFMFMAYVDQVADRYQLDKARLRADLNDRIFRIGTLSESFPAQFMTPELKQLLIRLELNLIQRIARLEKPTEALTERESLLQEQEKLGIEISIDNQPCPLSSEAAFKAVNFQLETLNSQIHRAVQDGLLTKADASNWFKSIRHWLTQSNLEMFDNMAAQALESDQPRLAKRAYERGLQYIRNQSDQTAFQSQREAFEKGMELAEETIAKQTEAEQQLKATPLEEKTPEPEGSQWKKKPLYDKTEA